MNRRDFLKLLSLSSASILTPGFLTNNFLIEISDDVIPVEIMIGPNVFRHGRNDEFSSTIVFPEGYNVTEVDISSVECEGAYVQDSILFPDERTIVFLFNSGHLKIDLIHTLSASFTITGYLHNGFEFKGSDAVMIIGEDQPIVYHISSRKHKSCHACKCHALNRIYSSMQEVDNDRPHPGCNCRIVMEHIGWQDYAKAFWHKSRGGIFVYDKRWDWSPPTPEGLNLKYPLFLEKHLRRG